MSRLSAGSRKTRSGRPTKRNSPRCGKKSSRPRFDVVPTSQSSRRRPGSMAGADIGLRRYDSDLSARKMTAIASPTARWRVRDAVLLAPKILLTGLLVLAIGDMVVGVFLRYVVVAITDRLDLDPVNFFWVEEVGEYSLAWLTMIGAGFGALALWYGIQLAIVNSLLTSPALEINLAWLYAAPAVGGALIILYGLAAAFEAPPPTETFDRASIAAAGNDCHAAGHH